MIKKNYALISGLHFALLQFGYVLLLQMNLSSTYLTYMIISLSWITGSLLGLWWKTLNPLPALATGIASYYLIYTVIALHPFEAFILPLSAMGIMLTGLWAGRFFVILIPLFEKTDQLFLMENNGFILGIMAIFLGFSLFGTHFMLWAPSMTSLLLLASSRWLQNQTRSFK